VAVTGLKRFAELPRVQTVDESGVPGYNATGWYGFYAPAGTPQDTLRRIHAETTKALGNPETKDRLARAGNEYVMSTPEEFVAFMRAEIAKWSKVVKEAGIRAE
jgi:tripartite-type tricarboxylate transporter receptor subunit TctC